jgi:type VI secretion system protein ImpB
MSGQKFIGRNRAPRVQIEYDVELYGAQKKVQLPFVMGVLADLSGTPAEAPPPVADRKFLEVSVDNFDDRLSAMKPRFAGQAARWAASTVNVSFASETQRCAPRSPAARLVTSTRSATSHAL